MAAVTDSAALPEGGGLWDAHVHVFDGDAPAQAGHYRPAHCPLERIERQAAAHGVQHLVLVQPSVYGTDNTVLLDALAARPGRHRGVAVVDAQVSDAALDRMHALGVRGVRFNRVSPVGNGPAAFQALAPRLRERGWHVQWYAAPGHLAEIAALHAGAGVACVLDHLAGMHAALPGGDPAWGHLAALAGQGAWIKLSGWYRLGAQAPYAALHDAIRRVAALAPGRLVWGSDWPHTAFAADALPAYESVWQPVAEALSPHEAAAARRDAARLYA
ncbi:amidohydrolase family protein [Paracidovorax wautersii]|uniref:Predicted metal-dependent hydrolase, TIM-barrel fold n=1 Tax=Paracidovorax wautersii TaxID=1177982 RepID=A0A1I2G8T1_9BURK|nr:amidohydrolase family protein [Paracidovorax wautersii]SFF13031.1 Predicted metal-dependent hydrolase, TIM-barrel fold [Paracidovorax wautersii]